MSGRAGKRRAPSTCSPGREVWVELAQRDGGGIDVFLHWSRSTGRTRVTIVHRASRRRAVLEVPPSDALVAFRHPFGYDALMRAQSRRPARAAGGGAVPAATAARDQ